MHDIITILNDAAKELLTEAHRLEAAINNATDKPEELKKQLKRFCKILTIMLNNLEHTNSPLRRLVNWLGGIKLSATSERLGEYLREHGAAFERLGIPKEIIESAMNSLRLEAKGSENALDKPQTVTIDDVIKPISEFRDLVCKIAKGATITLTPVEIARQVVKGAIGTATVVVDITGGIHAAPVDPTCWVVFKAVKSVCAGVRMVKKAVANIKEMIRRK